MSNVKFKIVEVHPEYHQVVVRFYTDAITPAMLCNLFDPVEVPDPSNPEQTIVQQVPRVRQDGELARCRTDQGIDVPVPAPADMHAFLSPCARLWEPWFDVQEAVLDAQVDTSLSSAQALMGQEMTPVPLPPINPVPELISPFQARAVLLQQGLLSQVEAMMADAGTPEIARLAWDRGTEVRRDSPTVAALAASLGLTSEQLDAMFIAGSQIAA